LVALGILFCPAFAGLLVQRAVIPLSIFATSLTDASVHCRTRRADRLDASYVGRAKYFVVDQLQLILVQRELLDWP